MANSNHGEEKFYPNKHSSRQISYDEFYSLAKEPPSYSFACPNKKSKYHTCNRCCELLWTNGLPIELKDEISQVGGATPGCGGEIYLEAMKSFTNHLNSFQ